MNRYAIAATRPRGQRRVDCVGRQKFDFHICRFDHERPWSPYWLQELWSGPADAGREISKKRTPATTFSLLMAEWHTPIRFLDAYRRDQLYPYAETFCVLREPTQHLASVAG